ncbi:unnamed protein product [Pedinophyceae sp. YPF-701]|nr:unnamed protein product [Pedinophyceae sp. YPF-701]
MQVLSLNLPLRLGRGKRKKRTPPVANSKGAEQAQPNEALGRGGPAAAPRGRQHDQPLKRRKRERAVANSGAGWAEDGGDAAAGAASKTAGASEPDRFLWDLPSSDVNVPQGSILRSMLDLCCHNLDDPDRLQKKIDEVKDIVEKINTMLAKHGASLGAAADPHADDADKRLSGNASPLLLLLVKVLCGAKLSGIAVYKGGELIAGKIPNKPGSYSHFASQVEDSDILGAVYDGESQDVGTRTGQHANDTADGKIWPDRKSPDRLRVVVSFDSLTVDGRQCHREMEAVVLGTIAMCQNQQDNAVHDHGVSAAPTWQRLQQQLEDVGEVVEAYRLAERVVAACEAAHAQKNRPLTKTEKQHSTKVVAEVVASVLAGTPGAVRDACTRVQRLRLVLKMKHELQLLGKEVSRNGKHAKLPDLKAVREELRKKVDSIEKAQKSRQELHLEAARAFVACLKPAGGGDNVVHAAPADQQPSGGGGRDDLSGGGGDGAPAPSAPEPSADERLQWPWPDTTYYDRFSRLMRFYARRAESTPAYPTYPEVQTYLDQQLGPDWGKVWEARRHEIRIKKARSALLHNVEHACAFVKGLPLTALEQLDLDWDRWADEGETDDTTKQRERARNCLYTHMQRQRGMLPLPQGNYADVEEVLARELGPGWIDDHFAQVELRAHNRKEERAEEAMEEMRAAMATCIVTKTGTDVTAIEFPSGGKNHSKEYTDRQRTLLKTYAEYEYSNGITSPQGQRTIRDDVRNLINNEWGVGWHRYWTAAAQFPDETKSSQWTGVCWSKQYGKWQAKIRACGKSHMLGVYECEDTAALAYNEACEIVGKQVVNDVGEARAAELAAPEGGSHIRSKILAELREAAVALYAEYEDSNGSTPPQRPDETKRSRWRYVSWSKQYGKWTAQIEVRGKRHVLGVYECEDTAALAHNEACEIVGKQVVNDVGEARAAELAAPEGGSHIRSKILAKLRSLSHKRRPRAV